jgi:hypothetical protein
MGGLMKYCLLFLITFTQLSLADDVKPDVKQDDDKRVCSEWATDRTGYSPEQTESKDFDTKKQVASYETIEKSCLKEKAQSTG